MPGASGGPVLARERSTRVKQILPRTHEIHLRGLGLAVTKSTRRLSPSSAGNTLGPEIILEKPEVRDAAEEGAASP